MVECLTRDQGVAGSGPLLLSNKLQFPQEAVSGFQCINNLSCNFEEKVDTICQINLPGLISNRGDLFY